MRGGDIKLQLGKVRKKYSNTTKQLNDRLDNN